MNIIQCPEGHYYDAERYREGCPYCQTHNTVSNVYDFANGGTIEAAGAAADDSYKTLPLGVEKAQSAEADKTVFIESAVATAETPTQRPIEEISQADEGVTIPIIPSAEPVDAEDADGGATLPIYEPATAATAETPTQRPIEEISQADEGVAIPIVPAAEPVDVEDADGGATMPIYEPATAATAETLEPVNADKPPQTLPISENTLFNIKRCPQNHLYDGQRFFECPYCKNNVVIEEDNLPLDGDFAPPVSGLPQTGDDENVTTPIVLKEEPVAPADVDSGAALQLNGDFAAPVSDLPQIDDDEGVTTPIVLRDEPAAPADADSSATLPLSEGFATPVSDLQASNNAANISYNAFLKEFVPKKKRHALIAPGIWLAIYSAIVLFVFGVPYGAVFAAISAVLAVLIILKKRIVFPCIVIGMSLILFVISALNGSFGLGFLDWLTIGTAVEAIIIGSALEKSYKEYKKSGTPPVFTDKKEQKHVGGKSK